MKLGQFPQFWSISPKLWSHFSQFSFNFLKFYQFSKNLETFLSIFYKFSTSPEQFPHLFSMMCTAASAYLDSCFLASLVNFGFTSLIGISWIISLYIDGDTSG